VYEQEASFYSFRQERMTNPQWYDRFNTKVDVGEAIGVTLQHKVLHEYVAQELHQKTLVSLTKDEQHAVWTDAEERYIAFAFLRQSGAQHTNLKMDLQNDYTTEDNRYQKNRQQTLQLLDRYSKSVVPEAAQSEGASFAQKRGRQAHPKSSKGNPSASGKVQAFDKEYWKDTTCLKCNTTGHPATQCPSYNDDDDDTRSRSSQAKSLKELKKDMKNMKKAFAQLQEAKQESDILGQMDQMTQTDPRAHHTFSFMVTTTSNVPRRP
jgi:hypothetical protein